MLAVNVKLENVTYFFISKKRNDINTVLAITASIFHQKSSFDLIFNKNNFKNQKTTRAKFFSPSLTLAWAWASGKKEKQTFWVTDFQNHIFRKKFIPLKLNCIVIFDLKEKFIFSNKKAFEQSKI